MQSVKFQNLLFANVIYLLLTIHFVIGCSVELTASRG